MTNWQPRRSPAAALMVAAITSLAIAAAAARAQETCGPTVTDADGNTSQSCVTDTPWPIDCATQPHQSQQPDGTIGIDLVICPSDRETALARQLRRERANHTRQLRRLRTELRAARRTWRPTVDHAIALAAATYAVDRDKLRRVATCESTLNPTARNGRYVGLYQFGLPLWNGTRYRWFDRTDPYAAALAAAWAFSRGMHSHWPECGSR